MNSYHYHRQAKIDKAIDKTGGVYPGGDSDEYLHSGLHGAGYVASRWTHFTAFGFVCTRAEFEARKAVRQNKPDWAEAPDWARYLAQDSSGHWYWFSSEPHIGLANGWVLVVGKYGFSQSGTVIGDWRHTLEQRPNHIGEPGEKAELVAKAKQAAKVALNIAVGSPVLAVQYLRYVMPSLFDNSPKSGPSVDWYDYENRIATKLPPVGIECIAFDDTRVQIIGLAAGGYIVYRDLSTGLCGTACQIETFHPIDWDRLELQVEPQLSPELSFHLSNAFNELQASARLLPEDDPRRSALAGIAGAVNAVREVA